MICAGPMFQLIHNKPKKKICQTFNYQMNEMLLVLPETNHPEIFQVWNIKCRENFVCTENLTISSVHYWNLNTVKIFFTISRPHTFCVQEWSCYPKNPMNKSQKSHQQAIGKIYCISPTPSITTIIFLLMVEG